ncbi:MAG: T9SS type A sorting domain-containing protein [Ferruginibacter sp.]|nr:T9SS type A sorting domain-containing protein [Chitinophagaceae bacterium]MBP6286300.1 T9SS type A sorting domain-containing protein [Ferruginibacter sp.]MBU9935678.1 T9SS type A sorting domain-containing protein [Ferruginibacter sp.]HQY11447.1 T9SS type A sorting domain-containing protein [Ferruginibacter sp.]
MRKVRLLLFTVGIFFSLGSFAQSVTPATLNATGGNYPFTYYYVEWSFGESMAIETLSESAASNIVVTSGILQPGTHNPATINNNGTWDRDEIKVLPNPTPDVLEIDFFSKQSGKVTMSLYDETGRFLGNRQFDYYGTGRIEKWSLGRYPSGMYFLNIQLAPTGNSVSKKGTFKVQKIR